MYSPAKIVDVVMEIASLTVKELRVRARFLRDHFGLKARFRGLWNLRKRALASLVAEVTLELSFNTSATGDEIMLQDVRKMFAQATALGMADGVKAVLNSGSTADHSTESVEVEAAEAVNESMAANSKPAIEHKPDDNKTAATSKKK